MNKLTTHADDPAHVPEVVRAWRANAIGPGAIGAYLRWGRCFHRDCRRRGADMVEQLREDIIRCWAGRYARRRGTDPEGDGAHSP